MCGMLGWWSRRYRSCERVGGDGGCLLNEKYTEDHVRAPRRRAGALDPAPSGSTAEQYAAKLGVILLCVLPSSNVGIRPRIQCRDGFQHDMNTRELPGL